MKRLLVSLGALVAGVVAQNDPPEVIEKLQAKLEKKQNEMDENLAKHRIKVKGLTVLKGELAAEAIKQTTKFDKFMERMRKRCKWRKEVKHLHKDLAGDLGKIDAKGKTGLDKIDNLLKEVDAFKCPEKNETKTAKKKKEGFLQAPGELNAIGLQKRIDELEEMRKKNQQNQWDQIGKLKSAIGKSKRRLDHLAENTKKIQASEAECAAKYEPQIKDWKKKSGKAMDQKQENTNRLVAMGDKVADSIEGLLAKHKEC